MTAGGALASVAAFGAHAAVVFGSGLAGLPHGAEVGAELGYAELGWPCTEVPGHANLLRLVSVPWPGLGPAPESAAGEGARLRLALACGRPHRYEGWSEAELARPVADLAAAGVSRLLLTNSCGALHPAVRPGDIVACAEVVDLQAPPPSAGPERLFVCAEAQATAVTAAMRPVARVPQAGVRAGSAADGETASAGAAVYVSVAGPQFETPAEVEWLTGYGDVVGMSAAPELRAARAAGATSCLLGLVANRAAAVGSHEDVLAVGAALAGALAAVLPAAVCARWPDICTATTQGAAWTS